MVENVNSSQIALIKDIRSLVAYHRSLGIEEYPLAAATLLQSRPQNSYSPALQPEADTAADAVPAPVQPVVAGETLADIAQEVGHCYACELHQSRERTVAGQGGARARLMVVGGWLTTLSAGDDNHVFGMEEDRMVALMMKAIHLAPEDVFVTNILKCGLPETVQPTAVHLECCLAFLRRQISVVAPEVICVMGTIPTRVLLDLSQPLSRLRGRFYPYTSLEGRKIPVMPTYHPSYLLRVPDMKAKTWEDLQRIQKQLAG